MIPALYLLPGWQRMAPVRPAGCTLGERVALDALRGRSRRLGRWQAAWWHAGVVREGGSSASDL